MSNIKLNFDISEMIKSAKLTNAEINEFVSEALVKMGDSVLYQWRELAHSGLHSTRDTYIRGLSEVELSGKMASIILSGALPLMIEDGAEAFDMKDGFRKSGKVKQGKNGGWYFTIPYRFASSNSLGENEAFSKKLPQEVGNVLKGKNPTTRVNDKNIYGGKVKESELSSQYQGKLIRPEIKTEKKIYGTYTHKSNIYEGMIKTKETYAKTTQNKTMSFRRVSANSDSLSWIHPGFVKRNFAEQSLNKVDMDSLLNNLANNFLDRIGK